MTLLLSDVLGNDPNTIASGPTVPGHASGNDALAILERYQVMDRVPKSVVSVLHDLKSNQSTEPISSESDVVLVVADNALAIEAARAHAASAGLNTTIVWDAKTGKRQISAGHGCERA